MSPRADGPQANSGPGSRPAALLDRDGTVIDEFGYLGDPERLRMLPRTAAAIRRLNEAAVPVVLVTNQSGLARGLFDEADLERVHARLAEHLVAEGAHLDAIYFAAHHPEFPHAAYDARADWRKPEPGMLLAAAADLGLDLGRSMLVGDTLRDLEAGRRAEVGLNVLVETGKGRDVAAGLDPEQRAGLVVLPHLEDAVERFLSTWLPDAAERGSP